MAKTILIIDDEQDMRTYLSTLFRTAGYTAETAENGDQGVLKARELAPDLITLDVLMPRKSGVKAYHDLKTTPETMEIPVIVLTGLAQREDFFGENLGGLPTPAAVLEKPIERETFLKQVEEIIGR
jgi:CheY-like chemotaxis protein